MKTSNIARKTKIICTIGPASDSREMLSRLVKAGMNVMRLNFSHGTHEEHLKKIELLEDINQELKTNVALLLDTKGPEIRTGDFEGGVTRFAKGQQCIICADPEFMGTSDKFSVSYEKLYDDVNPGSIILVNDGQVELVVEKVQGTDIICRCENDGEVKNKRGINAHVS